MNIAIFTNNYLPNPYGVTQSVESFRRQLEKNGHSVFIFAPNYKNYKDKNPRVFRYPALDIEFKIKFPLAIPYSRRIDKILEHLKIDIIHSQHPNLLGTAAMKWARKKNIPLVFTWHTLYDQYAHFVPFLPAKMVANYIIKKAVRYANDCDFVITPTESVKKIIQNWEVTNKNIETVSSGVDEENFVNPNGKIIRDKHGIKDDEVLLLLVSRLTKEKNVEFILDSLIPLLKRCRGVHPIKCAEGVPTKSGFNRVKFLITGGGDLVPKLKKTVADNNLDDKIIFEDVVGRRGIKNYYAAGDIFVYASKSETQGMIITEAMYCGLPIVAVDATGVSDLVENNVNGVLVSEDKNNFAEAVGKLIQNKNLREELSNAGAEMAREKYTDEACTGKLIDVYKNAIELI
jgi:1,2-diacylglycerol 3-alpha-glucosyltransferase